MNADACPICNRKENFWSYGGAYTGIDASQFSCDRCGIYAVTGPAWYELQALDDTKRALLSSFTRERTIKKLEVVMLTTSTFIPPNDNFTIPFIRISEAIAQFPQKVSDRLDRALMNLKLLSPFTGAQVLFDIQKDSPIIFADSFEQDSKLFMYNLLQETDYVSISAGTHHKLKINLHGWTRIYELESQRIDTKTAFIAMAFAPEYDRVWHAIEDGAVKSGFEPFRVNQSETNGKICDEIIAQIQRSKFMIADFTGQRKGVYFEAGYAMGIGIPVIWSCNSQEIKDGKLHFDTRQYNHIDWETHEELTTRLHNRIQATIK